MRVVNLCAGEYSATGEGRWLRGHEAAGIVERDRILSYSSDLDEYEAAVVLLERAIGALPSKSEEQHLKAPWNDNDKKARLLVTVCVCLCVCVCVCAFL
jgi:hypothetical protein